MIIMFDCFRENDIPRLGLEAGEAACCRLLIHPSLVAAFRGQDTKSLCGVKAHLFAKFLANGKANEAPTVLSSSRFFAFPSSCSLI